MDKSTLGNRMKKYENSFNFVFPPRIPLMLRLDGVHFSKNVKRWQSKKPFDKRLTYAMQMTSKGLAEEIAGTCLVYSQSDEITMLIRDDMTYDTQPWHGKEMNKILSVAAAKATKLFNYYFFEPQFCDSYPKYTHLAEFDCRAYILPEQEIINAFIWRQRDCTKNSVQMLYRSVCSHNSAKNKNGSELQDILMLEHNINWNDCAPAFKRGFTVYKKDIMKSVPKRDENNQIIKDETTLISRPAWCVDLETPIFTKDPNFINRFTKVCA